MWNSRNSEQGVTRTGDITPASPGAEDGCPDRRARPFAVGAPRFMELAESSKDLPW